MCKVLQSTAPPPCSAQARFTASQCVDNRHLDSDAPLSLHLQLVQVLPFAPCRDGPCDLHQAISKSALPVIYVGYDAEVAYLQDAETSVMFFSEEKDRETPCTECIGN